MTKNAMSIRLDDLTRSQLEELTTKYNTTQARIVATAIDRMYREIQAKQYLVNQEWITDDKGNGNLTAGIRKALEMTTETNTITIERINTKPEHDPYASISGIASRTTLKLDPRDRTVWVTQEYNDNSTPMDEWNNLVLTWGVNSYPTEADMREWITDNLDTLTTICDGFEAHWDGSNIVGRYTDEARAAAESIEFLFDNDGGPINHYEFWTVESWLESSRDEITADMTDEQLQELAEDWEGTDDIVVDGDILKFITDIRDTLKYEQEADESDEE